MRRVLFWVMVVPAIVSMGFAATVGDPWRVAVDAVGALFVVAAAMSIARHEPAESSFRLIAPRLVLVAFALVATLYVASGDPHLPWPPATIWCSVVLAGLLAAHSRDVWTMAAAAVVALYPVGAPLPLGWPNGYIVALEYSAATIVSMVLGVVLGKQGRTIDRERKSAGEQERRRLADELHDVIAHEIAGIVVLSQAIRQLPSGADASRGISQIEEAGSRALLQIRSLVSTLRDTDTVPSHPRPARTDLVGGMQDIVADFAPSTAATVKFVGPDRDVSRIDPALVTSSHRILTEALTNVHRHAASAREVTVTVTANERTMMIEVVDDGRGGGLGPGGGYGVAGIQARAELVGGTAEAGRRADGKWAVTATLPLRRGKERT